MGGLIATLVLAAFAIGEAFVIFHLFNRLLVQAKIAPISLREEERPEVPTPLPPRKLFSMKVNN